MLRNRDQGKFKPPSDVIATEDKFIILVEIAGMNVEDFKLSLINRQLVISGNRPLAHIDNHASYQQVEIEAGEFRLSYTLQKPVVEDQVTANYQNGLLQVELPYMPKQTVKVVMADIDKKDN